jgi:hypothetical protein
MSSKSLFLGLSLLVLNTVVDSTAGLTSDNEGVVAEIQIKDNLGYILVNLTRSYLTSIDKITCHVTIQHDTNATTTTTDTVLEPDQFKYDEYANTISASIPLASQTGNISVRLVSTISPYSTKWMTDCFSLPWNLTWNADQITCYPQTILDGYISSSNKNNTVYDNITVIAVNNTTVLDSVPTVDHTLNVSTTVNGSNIDKCNATTATTATTTTIITTTVTTTVTNTTTITTTLDASNVDIRTSINTTMDGDVTSANMTEIVNNNNNNNNNTESNNNTSVNSSAQNQEQRTDAPSTPTETGYINDVNISSLMIIVGASVICVCCMIASKKVKDGHSVAVSKRVCEMELNELPSPPRIHISDM